MARRALYPIPQRPRRTGHRAQTSQLIGGLTPTAYTEVNLTAAAGTTTFQGGTAAAYIPGQPVNLTATGGSTTFDGGDVVLFTLATTLEAADGATTFAGGTASLTITVAAATGSATFAGGTVTYTGGNPPTNLTAAAGTTTLAGGATLLTFNYVVGTGALLGPDLILGAFNLGETDANITFDGGTATAYTGIIAVRQLGAIIVTTAAKARPIGLAHTRAQGTPTTTGRHITLPGLARTRAQGSPRTTGSRALPIGQAHTRALGAARTLVTASPVSITHARAQGTGPAVTIAWIARPAPIAHTRALGTSLTIKGRQTLIPAGLAHARAQGNPTLSGRALPASITHTRGIAAPHVNVIALHPAALARA